MRTIRPVPLWPVLWRVAVALPFVLGGSEAAGQGQLGNVRADVRTPPPPAASPARERSKDRDRSRHREHDHDSGSDDSFLDDFKLAFAWTVCSGVALTVTSPFWGPRVLLGDNGATGGFARFPYRHTPGYMVGPEWVYGESAESKRILTVEERVSLACGEPVEECQPVPIPGQNRRWSARFRVDYADEFDELSRVGGHLLLSTASRVGLDTEMSFLQEKLSGSPFDGLWLGDCNIVYRFAQSPKMQWRAGLGFSWLDDPIQTDYGFNFTYGFDWFPCKPWVISAELDWGTLGHAELFHFRTTAGVVIHGIEAYTGYEYYDIDRTQISSLIAGVRLWF